MHTLKRQPRRSADQSWFRFPDEVSITDVVDESASGSGTPAGEQDDDFFSSWDKPTIKRPSNPPSRTGTPPVISRTASPANGLAKVKSPLNGEGAAAAAPAPAAPRTLTSSAALRKTTTTTAAKKSSILGAKKKGLGVKKVAATDAELDFDEMERKAKEEAERIEKLGYDPESETPPVSATAAKIETPAQASNVIAPTPISPTRGGFGATAGKSDASVERLGMGVARLGFGQMAAPKQAAGAAAPRKMGGFGSTSRGPAADGKTP